MDKVFIVGAFGGVNVGDEAIAYAMINGVRQINSTYEVSILALSGHITSEAQKAYDDLSVKVIPRKNIFSAFYKASQARIILGGGQVLNGERFPKFLLLFVLMFAVNKLFGHKPIITGVGATNTDVNRLTRTVLKCLLWLSNSTSVRDDETLAKLEELKPSKKINRYPDVVWSLANTRKFTEARKNKDRNLAILAIYHHPKKHHLTMKQYADIVDHLTTAHGLDVVLVAHDIRSSFDLGGCDKIISISKTKCKIVALTDLDVLIDLYKDASIVISSRMHPLILGRMCGAYPIPIICSSKVEEFSREYELQNISTEKGDINAQLSSIFLNTQKENTTKMEMPSEDSLNQFDVLKT